MRDQSKTKQTLTQKKASLDDALEYAENIIDTVREPLIALDQDLRVVKVSRSFYEFFKVKPEETVGQLIYNLGNKQWDIPKLRELLEDILPKKVSFDNYEVEHEFVTIGKRIMLLNARQIEQRTGKKRIILLAIEDITERKEIEAGLEKTRKELVVIKNTADETSEFAESVINTVREPLIALDQDLRVVKVSRSFYEYFKVNPEETVGQLIYDLGNKQWDIPKLRELLEDILPKKVSFDNYEVEHNFSTIGWRVMLLNARQIKQRTGKERIILLAIEDITERKKYENLLKDSEELYKGIFNTASDGIFLLEKHEGKIIHINPSAEKMLGYSPKESIGNKLQDVGFMFDMDDFQTIMQNLNKNGIINYTNIPLTTKSGQFVYADIYLVNKTKAVQCNIRDVTERKLAEEALDESIERYRSIFENTVMGISQALPSGRLITANNAYAEIYGYASAEEMMAEAPEVGQRYANQEDRKEVLRILKEKGVMKPREIDIIRRNGTRLTVLVSAREIRDSNGNLQYYQSEHIDITKRKRAEESLKASEKQYRLLADHIHDVIFVMDMNLKYTYVSPSVKILRGYNSEETLKHTIAETLTPSSMDLTIRTLSEIIEIEKSEHRDINISRTLDLEMRRKDGTTIWTEVKASFIRDENQQPVGIMGVTRDITERKWAETILKQSEEKYRSIFENTQEGIFRTTPNGKIIMANQALSKMFGYESPEEFMADITDVGRQLYVNPEDRRKLKETIEKHGFIKGYEVQNHRKDGSIIWISLTMNTISDGKGQILYYDGINEDITTRKESAERIRKALGATAQAIAVTIEMRDPYTAGHQRRVADLASSIAKEMNLPDDQIFGIHMAATIHDIGKISVPSEILSKPTKLKKMEFDLIKEHSQSGYDILKDIDFPWPIARIVLEHHERMNGSGYPRNLTGNEILIEARIMAVADVVEAMASHRPYRASLGIEAALEEIEKNKGIIYDNVVADACLTLFREKGYQLAYAGETNTVEKQDYKKGVDKATFNTLKQPDERSM